MTIEQDEDTLAASIAEETQGAADEHEAPDTETEEVEEEEAEEPTEEESEEEGADEEADPEEETEDEGQEEEARPRGRGGERIRRLQAENARLRQERDQRERGNGGQQPPAQRPDPAQMKKALNDELAKHFDQFEFKTPAQRAEVFSTAIERVMSPVVRQLASAGAADRDRSAFRESYQNKPFYKQLSAKVEQQFADAAAQGYFIPREQFFKQAVADLALNGAGKSGGKQKRAADIRKQKAKGVSTTAKGDASRGSRGSGSFVKDFERKFGDKKI